VAVEARQGPAKSRPADEKSDDRHVPTGEVRVGLILEDGMSVSPPNDPVLTKGLGI